MIGEDDDSKPRRPSRALTREDRELWQHVTRSVERVDGKKRVRMRATADTETFAETMTSPEPQAPEQRPSPKARKRAPPIPPPQPSQPATLDRRKARRIAKGRERIEARIDLHGMRQSEAHVALRGFLLRCYADGLCRVLVITGKGTTSSPQDNWSYSERERGVLRRNVPRWLAEPELSAIISATAPAHARHGGNGALYITLRRPHRGDAD